MWPILIALSVGGVPAVASASSEQAFFEDITLPTDLIASVVDIEDDIQLGNLLDPTQPDPVSPVASSAPAPELTVPGQDSPEQSASANETGSTGSSIFSELEPEVVLAEDIEPESVQEAEKSAESVAPVRAEPEVASERVVSSATGDTPDSSTEPAIEQAAEPTDSKQSSTEPETELAAAAPALTLQQEQAVDEDKIILGWATAWSNNDTETYLSYYDETFQPADPALTRAAWESLRRERLKNQEIRIIVSNAELVRSEDDFAEVRFTQRYTSKTYKDRVIKAITMRRTPDGWKFLSEQTIEKLPFK